MNGHHNTLEFCAHFVSSLCPFRDSSDRKLLKDMVGTSGFEPLTSTVSR
jgi:hypothetical protein